MRRFAGASAKSLVALRTDEELDDYTYRVAGCVGEFWTKMCRAHLFPQAPLDDAFLLANGVRFGKGLQLVNILRDVAADLRQGRCYLPAERLAGSGLKPEDLLQPANEPRLRPLYHAYLDRAEAHLLAGWAYTNALPRRSVRVRLACAWPILIGLETLNRLRAGNALDPAQRIKVTRRQVRQLMLRSVLLYPWPRAWEKMVRPGKLLRRLPFCRKRAPMQISKSFLVVCAVAYCMALLPLRAADVRCGTQAARGAAKETQRIANAAAGAHSATECHHRETEDASRSGGSPGACPSAGAGRRVPAGGLGSRRQGARGFAPEDDGAADSSRRAAYAAGTMDASARDPAFHPARRATGGAGARGPAGAAGPCSRRSDGSETGVGCAATGGLGSHRQSARGAAPEDERTGDASGASPHGQTCTGCGAAGTRAFARSSTPACRAAAGARACRRRSRHPCSSCRPRRMRRALPRRARPCGRR